MQISGFLTSRLSLYWILSNSKRTICDHETLCCRRFGFDVLFPKCCIKCVVHFLLHKIGLNIDFHDGINLLTEHNTTHKVTK